MSFRNLASALLLILPAIAAEMPLPELRIEPAAAGSVFFVKNVSPQSLTAFLIELVDYPGSGFAMVQDESTAEPIAPGVERRIPTSSMIVAAAPNYTRILAAIYADGSSGGAPRKVSQLANFRRAKLEATRELIKRMEKAKADATPKEALLAGIKEYGESITPPDRRTRYLAAGIESTAIRGFIAETAAGLNAHSLDIALGRLRTSERALAAAKP
jgi:hypothetical protein